jgi:hypothetical protein
MITVESDPSCLTHSSPDIYSYWLATESPNIFRLLRRDWLASGADNGGFLELTVAAFTGNDDDSISVHDLHTDSMYKGTITSSSATTILTDIPWVATMDIDYMNDNTLYGGFYFEGRLTINGVVQPLTIIASPDSLGFADLDVSGVLRISTSLGKNGDYSTLLMKEETKSGNFTFEYRERYFGSSDLTVYTPLASPNITWYYGEAVRSEEQGSNLLTYVADAYNDAPFLNSFERPVYFHGLPWDISFILPELNTVSPAADITVTIQFYNSFNASCGIITTTVDVDALTLDGHIVSLTIDPAQVPAGAVKFTIEITAP